jgi:hypothetical protein
MPHDGWRELLPFIIDVYKFGTATVDKEAVVAWYRLNPSNACSGGGTTGNAASLDQRVYKPGEVVQDKVFFSALLVLGASASVSIGGVRRAAAWTSVPDGGIGIYHGSIPFSGLTGAVVVTISRNGRKALQMSGASISTSRPNGLNNWNAWVGSASGEWLS